MTDVEKDVGCWLYKEINLYPLKQCQFMACRSVKLPEELIFLVTNMDQCMAGGWQGGFLRFLGLDIREMQVRLFMLSVLEIIKEPHMIFEVHCQCFNS